MVITLGQQYNVGEKPTVILYTYINRGTFFPQNFESEFSKNSDPPAEPKLESEFWPNSDPSSGLDNLVLYCVMLSPFSPGRERKRELFSSASIPRVIFSY